MKRRKLEKALEKNQEEREFASGKFRDALSSLLKENKILGFIETRPNSTLDHEGIDWMVFLHGGLTAVIQIKQKTSGNVFKNRLKRHFELHPHILILFGVERRHKARSLARRIVVKINKMIRQTKEISLIGESPESPPLIKPPL